MLPFFMRRWSWASKLDNRLMNDRMLVTMLVILGVFAILGLTAWLGAAVVG